ncbi:MAG: 3D domain-containing protein [Dysosmobacter sp.]|nr:3D domain-containing protein [Dysosmobacter sp.]
MSQKNEKLRRQVERLKTRVDAMECSAASWDAAEASAHSQAVLDAATERNAERRRARQAERTAALWRRVAYIALVAAIIVEIIAILVIHANAACTAPVDPSVGVTASETAPAPMEGPEEAENERIEVALLARAHVIEDCVVTHYDCCVQCCGKDDGITASGVRATPGVTVAVDPNVIPLGSDVLVDYGDGEIEYYRADDVGGAVKGNHIDLCVGSHEEALQLGRRTATVYWVAAE